MNVKSSKALMIYALHECLVNISNINIHAMSNLTKELNIQRGPFLRE